MNIKILSIIPIIGIFLLTACDKSVPKCSDKNATDIVIKLTKEKAAPMLGDKINDTKIVVKDIITTEFNKETGSYSCKANVVMKVQGNALPNIPITYTTEVTDDGKDFYVSVYGL